MIRTLESAAAANLPAGMPSLGGDEGEEAVNHYPGAAQLVALLVLAIALFGPAEYSARPRRTIILGSFWIVVMIAVIIAHHA